MPGDNITILHLSDLQFGKNHRFGRLALPPPDDRFDTLFARLRDDLDCSNGTRASIPGLRMKDDEPFFT